MKRAFHTRVIINMGILLLVAGMVGFTGLYAAGVIGQKTAEEQTTEETEQVTEGNGVLEQGFGTKESPFLIQDAKEFLKFAESVNDGMTYSGQYVDLMTDVDLQIMTEGIHIGIADSECQFHGIFNGNGHQIQNLNINRPDGEAGLFVNLGGTVCNLSVANGTIKGLVSGAIASSTNSEAVIANCYNWALVTGEMAGGITGKNKGTIANCANDMSAGTALLVGDSSGGVTEYCYNGSGSEYTYYCNNRGDETPPENVGSALDSLNHRIGGLSQLYPVSNWQIWEMQGEQLVLTTQAADTIEEAWLAIETAGQGRKIAGYYSENEDAWCFAIPEGSQVTEWNTEVITKLENEDSWKNSIDTTDTSYVFAGIDYQFKYLINDTIPSVFVDTNEENSDGLSYLQDNKENELKGNLLLLNEKGSTLYNGMLDKISGRGNDSWLAAKKSYSFSLKAPADLLNMGTDNDYILLAGYRDNSLLTYKIIQDMAKEMQLPYAPESRFINLYIDGNYIGMYLLAEKMEIGTNRFDLNDLYTQTKESNGHKLSTFPQEIWKSDTTPATKVWYDIEKEPADHSGGYVLELDAKDYNEKQSRFISNRGISVTLKGNTYATKSQVDYISEYWQEFEDALYSEDGYNAQGNYYADYIDIESFADQWAMYELSEDSSLSGSVYFYKDSDASGDGKLHAAYAWDVEHSFIAEDSDVTTGWICNKLVGDMEEEAAGYWVQLYSHKDFAEQVYQEWAAKFVPAIQKLLQQEEVMNDVGVSSISGYERSYSYAGAINSTRWTNCNIWDKGERIRIFLTSRSQFLSTALACFSRDYDYIEETDGTFYGCYYALNETEEDRKVAIVFE